MPTYEYRCDDGHTFEVIQRMVDDPIAICEVCGKPVQRVFHPVAVHFKGSGFYNTDYGKSRGGGGGSDNSSGGGEDKPKTESSETKSDAKPAEAKKTESKPEPKKSG